MKWNYEEGRIYSINEEKELMAEVTFIDTGDKEVNINHTYVNPVLRGQGVAGKMLKVTAEYLREKGLKATASCSYAHSWLLKNKESYSDIISDDINKEA
ncbi:MAG: N-acetyltransferase [Clostridiales bacterium]|jgi:predicted GNAT family acetyltransferase|nr:N-acetyltransferase [Clostridiales bacterium]